MPLLVQYTEVDGTVRFKGFIVDLLDGIGAIVNFKYNLSLVPDGFGGAKMNATHWNGVIAELQFQVILSDDDYMCIPLLNNER